MPLMGLLLDIPLSQSIISSSSKSASEFCTVHTLVVVLDCYELILISGGRTNCCIKVICIVDIIIFLVLVVHGRNHIHGKCIQYGHVAEQQHYRCTARGELLVLFSIKRCRALNEMIGKCKTERDD